MLAFIASLQWLTASALAGKGVACLVRGQADLGDQPVACVTGGNILTSRDDGEVGFDSSAGRSA